MKTTTKNAAVSGAMRAMLLSLVLAGGISSESAIARAIVIEIGPPPARFEVIPVQRRGYTWAPGYWAWQRDRHVWVAGHSMRARDGRRWEADRWNQVDGRHHFQPGRWQRDFDRRGQ